MATLDKVQDSKDSPVTHLLLGGASKTGKSDYLAQAALDGFTIIYLDNDNGKSTLLDRVAGTPAAGRVHYFNPIDMVEWVDMFMDSAVFRFNNTTRKIQNTVNPNEEDDICEIIPALIPRNVIFSLDSWTSLAFSAIQTKAVKLGIDLTDADKYGRELYGSTGYKLTRIAGLLQAAPFHVVVQAHPGQYERKEKPPGVVGGIDEKSMIIKETVLVPLSTSMPHGYTLGKYFNQIGWLGINRTGARELDFRARYDRIGGGTPNAIGNPRAEFSFANLFGKYGSDAQINPEKPWIQYLNGAQYKARAAERQANRPKLGAGKLTSPAKV